ncbi:AsmA family protein [Xenorhabdus sp. XENO-7]|uniref:AsmA family protein n=1 Tax=Xenorhabdus aichiensis TaxID=3025874 RepID=A0ABT5M183_9GAMM|nr:AsmA family protein [Xenorhabdus aichiensis]MDC9620710.1 AsmA family protein [Xenorhabdus aichiensis]
MKWLRKFFVTLLLLLILAIIVIYIVVQTHWGTKQLNQWLNKQGHYKISIESISHSWLQPATLTLNNVNIHDQQSVFSLNANTVNLDLKWQHLLTPRNLHRLTLQQGKLILASDQLPPLLQADILQLNQMNIQLETPHTQIQGENITGGITPWMPAAGSPFGNGQYQFSASTMRFNGIPFEKIIMQGSYQNKTLTIDTFGAAFLQGAISGDGRQLSDGSWRWNNLLISNIRWQSPMTLSTLQEKTRHLPAIHVKDLNITNAKLQGKNWSVDYLDTTIKNLGLVNGSWEAKDGLIDFNVMNMAFNNAQFSNTLGQLHFSGDTFTVAHLTTHYQKGLFNIQSEWDRKNRQLTFSNSSVTGLVYDLPPTWRNDIKNAVPGWISGLKLNDISVNNTLLIDVNPDFPFQLTTLSGHVDTMNILKNGRWGLWEGQASLQAASGTFNKIEITRPYLQLHAIDDKLTIDKLSAFNGHGLLQASGSAEQQTAQKPFALNFKGMNADLGILPRWGWIPLTIQGEGNFSLAITGNLSADDIKGTINGTLTAEDKSSNKDSQSIAQGLILSRSCSPAGAVGGATIAPSTETHTAETGNTSAESETAESKTCPKIKL